MEKKTTKKKRGVEINTREKEIKKCIPKQMKRKS